MNEIKQLKEKQINDYISNILLNENDLNIDQLKIDLGNILGEKPGIDLEYKKESLLLEDGKQSKSVEKLDSIHVYFSYTDESNELRFSTLTYLAD